VNLRSRIYYTLKPLLPRRFQIWLRQQVAVGQRAASAGQWPILPEAGQAPPGWPGWPGGKQFAFVLRHDVETAFGQRQALALMQLDQAEGFRSCFNFVPERYAVSAEVRALLATHGFEVGVHGLNHDGRLYLSRAIFDRRAPKINRYLRAWRAVGFASPASHHQLAWNHALEIEYDSSTFDSDPFEGEPDPARTIFPMWVPGDSPSAGYVELPFTFAQDFEIFILLRQQTTDLWQRKLAWLAEKGGLALLIAHPDYMCFSGGRPGFQQYPVDYYRQFLSHIRTEYAGRYWQALPREVAHYYRQAVVGVEPRPAVRPAGIPAYKQEVV
jgi:hypothetical protein